MIGQDGPIKILKASVQYNKYNSAYMLSGPPGVGKTTAGRIFSKAILCDSPVEGNPCGVCESCSLFDREQHFNYYELDAASYGGKEDMVALRDNAAYLSVSKKKILMIDESHDISKQGQDALLKQTEECPDHLVYIFCTTEPDKMNETLRERCMEFQISIVQPTLIIKRLKYICEQENIKYQEEALQVIAEKSDGHVRNALNYLEEVAYLGEITLDNINTIFKDYDKDIFVIVSNLGKDLPKIVETYRSISSYVSSMKFYELLLSLVRDAAIFLYGYEDFPDKRKSTLSKLKEIHGYSLVEFLNYLTLRDKYVDKIGLLSDLITLHYKFSASNFAPIQRNNNSPENITQKQIPDAPSSIAYNQLSKMSIADRSKVLREQRKQKKEDLPDNSKIPLNWPLPKEDRPGESSDNRDLPADVFSQNLVGGRSGDEFKPVVDIRAE